MTEFPHRNMLKIGQVVRIRERSHDKIEEFEGKIKEILTNHETHPYGIKVELDNGKTGRVIQILNGSTTLHTDQIISSDEDQKTEFKSTFRLDLNRLEKGDGKKTVNKEVEKEIAVTISAMANADGGILFIGINDAGKVLGLENDYELLQNPNDDKFQRTIWQSIQNYINNMAYVSKLKLSLINKESKKICIIEIPKSDEPIFLHDNHTQESYVRIGPKSEKFNPSDFIKYCKSRF